MPLIENPGTLGAYDELPRQMSRNSELMQAYCRLGKWAIGTPHVPTAHGAAGP